MNVRASERRGSLQTAPEVMALENEGVTEYLTFLLSAPVATLVAHGRDWLLAPGPFLGASPLQILLMGRPSTRERLGELVTPEEMEAACWRERLGPAEEPPWDGGSWVTEFGNLTFNEKEYHAALPKWLTLGECVHIPDEGTALEDRLRDLDGAVQEAPEVGMFLGILWKSPSRVRYWMLRQLGMPYVRDKVGGVRILQETLLSCLSGALRVIVFREWNEPPDLPSAEVASWAEWVWTLLRKGVGWVGDGSDRSKEVVIGQGALACKLLLALLRWREFWTSPASEHVAGAILSHIHDSRIAHYAGRIGLLRERFPRVWQRCFSRFKPLAAFWREYIGESVLEGLPAFIPPPEDAECQLRCNISKMDFASIPTSAKSGGRFLDLCWELALLEAGDGTPPEAQTRLTPYILAQVYVREVTKSRAAASGLLDASRMPHVVTDYMLHPSVAHVAWEEDLDPPAGLPDLAESMLERLPRARVFTPEEITWASFFLRGDPDRIANFRGLLRRMERDDIWDRSVRRELDPERTPVRAPVWERSYPDRQGFLHPLSIPLDWITATLQEGGGRE